MDDSFKMEMGAQASLSPRVVASQSPEVVAWQSPGVEASQVVVSQSPEVVASQKPGVVAEAGVKKTVFQIDPVMTKIRPNEWTDYVMQKGHPEGHA